MTEHMTTADLTAGQVAEVEHVIDVLGAPDAQAVIDTVSGMAEEDGVSFADELDQADLVATVIGGLDSDASNEDDDESEDDDDDDDEDDSDDESDESGVAVL